MKRIFWLPILIFALSSTALAQRKLDTGTGPAGVPEAKNIKSITLTCRNGRAKEVVTAPEQITMFVSGLKGVWVKSTEKVPAPTTIVVHLKRGGIIKPKHYINGHVVFGTRHYKLGSQWLDRPLCGGL